MDRFLHDGEPIGQDALEESTQAITELQATFSAVSIFGSTESLSAFKSARDAAASAFLRAMALARLVERKAEETQGWERYMQEQEEFKKASDEYLSLAKQDLGTSH